MLRTHQKKLRKNATPVENLLWSFLRDRKLHGFKFRRQQIIGYYIVDFVCYEKKLIVELDGGQHLENKKYDDARTLWLNQQGFYLMRFWNINVPGNVEKILDEILEKLMER